MAQFNSTPFKWLRPGRSDGPPLPCYPCSPIHAIDIPKPCSRVDHQGRLVSGLCPLASISGLGPRTSQLWCCLRVTGWLCGFTQAADDSFPGQRSEPRARKAQITIVGSSTARFHEEQRRRGFVNDGEHRTSFIGADACGISSLVLHESPHLGRQTVRGSSEAPIPRSGPSIITHPEKSERSIDRRLVLSPMPLWSGHFCHFAEKSDIRQVTAPLSR